MTWGFTASKLSKINYNKCNIDVELPDRDESLFLPDIKQGFTNIGCLNKKTAPVI